jgi:hypothetical protein
VTVSVAPLLSAVAGSRSEVVETGDLLLVIMFASLRLLMSTPSKLIPLILSIK